MAGNEDPAAVAPETFRPLRLCRGLAVIKDGPAFIIEGAPRRHRFTGQAAGDLLPRLLPLLDGRLGAADICAQLGVEAAQVEQILALLDRRGLLEPGSPDSQCEQLAEHVASYYSRNISAIGYRNASELAAALAASRVLLVAPRPLGDQIAADLAEAGVGEVRIHVSSDTVSAADVPEARPPGRGLVAVCAPPGAEQWIAEIEVRCRSRVPMLRFAGGPGYAELGPLFCDSYSACPECFGRGYRAAAFPGPGFGQSANGHDPTRPEAGASLLASLTVAEIFSVLGHMKPPSLRRLIRFTMPGYRREIYDVLPEPTCSRCAAYLPANDASQRAWNYEWLTQHRPQSLRWADPPPAEAERIASLQVRRDCLPWAPRYKLPPPWPIPLASRPAAGTGTEKLISGLLAHVAGYRGDDPSPDSGAPRRWSPSAGDLGATELYIVTGTALAKAPGAIFKYEAAGHQLASIRADTVPLSDILNTTDLDGDRVEFVVILVCAIGTLIHRYKSFSLRLGHLDAGCSTLQLSAVASSYGLRLVLASTWEPALAEALELDSQYEVIAAVAGVQLPRT